MGDKAINRPSNPTVTSRLKNIVKESPFFCKVIELILCVLAVGLIVDPFHNSETQPKLDHAGTVYVSICGYILINAIIILCYLIGERQPKRMSMVFSVVGGILCLATGILLIDNWRNMAKQRIGPYYQQYLKQMLSSGIFSLMAAVVFVIDSILTNKYEK